MTTEDLERLLDLIGNRPDELGRLTRMLLAEHVLLRAQQGDVDTDGEIVDALLSRIRAAIGDHRAADVARAAQIRLTLDLLQLAAAGGRPA
jgi:hypothetical protein